MGVSFPVDSCEKNPRPHRHLADSAPNAPDYCDPALTSMKDTNQKGGRKTQTDAEATLQEAIKALEAARQCLNNTESYQEDSNFSNLIGSYAVIVNAIKGSLEDFDPQEGGA